MNLHEYQAKELLQQFGVAVPAGIKVGTEGTVLAGRSGRDPLPDGTFKVIKVIDGSHSQAKSGVRSIGRNNRVVFFKD